MPTQQIIGPPLNASSQVKSKSPISIVIILNSYPSSNLEVEIRYNFYSSTYDSDALIFAHI